jgi:hypothetical protein
MPVRSAGVTIRGPIRSSGRGFHFGWAGPVVRVRPDGSAEGPRRPLAAAAAQGVPYTRTSLWQSYRVVIGYLNTVGLRGKDPPCAPRRSTPRPLSRAPLRSRRFASPNPVGPAEDLGDLGLAKRFSKSRNDRRPLRPASEWFRTDGRSSCLRIRPSRITRHHSSAWRLGGFESKRWAIADASLAHQ